MTQASVPIIFKSQEVSGLYTDLKELINKVNTTDRKYLLEHPVVYIHYWDSEPYKYVDSNGNEHKENRYEVYVGESNDVTQRTEQHYRLASDTNQWQHNLSKAKNPHIVIIGHKHFNKSFTLDVENQLIEYAIAMKSVNKIHNGRTNPQGKYYPCEEFNGTFQAIWTELMKVEKNLFLSESEITDSAIFKASPLKKLTSEQTRTKDLIISRVFDAIDHGKEEQLIFVQGEAGSGKTVLTTSTFYDLIKKSEDEDLQKLNCHLLVNHDQQLIVYKQIAKRLGLGEENINKPTSFINNTPASSKVDVTFIDEGHLLLTQGKQSYTGKNQLDDIIKRSRVTVVMFDEYQILTTEQYWESHLLSNLKKKSIDQDNYIELESQLRMQCSASTSKWLRSFIIDQKIMPFSPDNSYEVVSFNTPQEIYDAIEKKALMEESKLSRIVASYDWDYNSNVRPTNRSYWGVKIGNWFKPWNYELSKDFCEKEKKGIKNLAWAEQPHTIMEIGSTFSIQGFDLSYVGVILGPSVQYRNGKIVFDPSKSSNRKATQRRTLSDGSKHKFGETLIRNEVKVLMTRGIKGIYIYACDEALRTALKEIARI